MTALPLIDAVLSARYAETNYPALLAQRKAGRDSLFLKNRRILCATPLFFNTFGQYAALLDAGAELTLGLGPGTPFDPKARDLIQPHLRILSPENAAKETFDVILDCAAEFRNCTPRFGFSELTRTGTLHYQKTDRRVFCADESPVKALETCLGTGSSLLRALDYIGKPVQKGDRVLLFGHGKVGRGIALFLHHAGAELTVAEDLEQVNVPACVHRIDYRDLAAVNTAAAQARFIISATGRRHALYKRLDPHPLLNANTVLINMGVEDEWGPEFPASRIENAKHPFNFILEEPTEFAYIDPTLALHNAGAFHLIEHSGKAELITPPESLNRMCMEAVLHAGKLTAEIERMNQWMNAPC